MLYEYCVVCGQTSGFPEEENQEPRPTTCQCCKVETSDDLNVSENQKEN